MKNISLNNNDREFIKKKLLPNAVISFSIYSAITLALTTINVLIIKDLVSDFSDYTLFGKGITIVSISLLFYVIYMFGKYAIENGKRISCLMTGDYHVTDSVVEEMIHSEGRIYSTGPMVHSNNLVFKSADGDTLNLPQGRFRTPEVSLGQHAWLINYGVQNSFSVDYVLEPEAEINA